MGDEKCLLRIEPKNEALVPAPVGVVPQDFGDGSFAFDLNVALALIVSAGESRVTGARDGGAFGFRRVGRFLYGRRVIGRKRTTAVGERRDEPEGADVTR